MAFSRDDAWVWDFWLADDGDTFHAFYLFAPRSLGDPELRHRNARIGHAISPDLQVWTDLGEVLAPGAFDDFDASSTWTGSVVRGDDGRWWMFYTGSVFASPDSVSNVESIGVATSDDLHTWTKEPLVLRADERWYEKLGDSAWPEEAWRDPWVFRDPEGNGWHMLITARSREGHLHDRGVVGHARSDDMLKWKIGPPLSPTATGFGHLEVMQFVELDGDGVLLFSAPRGYPNEGGEGLVWALDGVPPLGPFAIGDAQLLTERRIYSPRVIENRDGSTVLLAFELGPEGGEFVGGITDPIPVSRREGRLSLESVEQVR